MLGSAFSWKGNNPLPVICYTIDCLALVQLTNISLSFMAFRCHCVNIIDIHAPQKTNVVLLKGGKTPPCKYSASIWLKRTIPSATNRRCGY